MENRKRRYRINSNACYKIYFTLFALFIYSCSNAQERIQESINSNWQFFKSEKLADTVGAHWENISLPHTYNIQDVIDDEPGYYRGVTWYRKKIYVPLSWKDKEVYLCFKGASQVATVYVNGKLAGKHIGSYTAFSFNVKNLLNWNDPFSNEILVQIDNSHDENIPPLSADFNFYGGLYRDAYLQVINPVHFDADNHASKGIFITTPDVSNTKASINIKGVICNSSSVIKTVLIQHTITDKNGNIVAQKQTPLQINANNNQIFETVFTNIKQPHLWSPETPYLYRVSSVIIDSATKNVLDEILNPLGFRWFKFTADKGFFLNGKHVKLIGASRHQDYMNMGNALPDALHEKDVRLLKDMGANFLRVAHYPQDPAVLEACDKLGIIASVETPVVNAITENDIFRNNCLNMQTEMIRQNYNHPSVVIWAYMNEVLLRMRYSDDKIKLKQYITNIAKLAFAIDSVSRREDASRYTMLPFHGDFDLYINSGLARIPQIVGWNQYAGWYSKGINKFEEDMEKHRLLLPDKPVIVTEFGADADSRVHCFEPERFDKSLEYETYFHSVYLKTIKEKPFISGAAMWNLADFGVENRAESMPHINNKGLLTYDRNPKEAYYYYQSQLLQNPYIKIGSKNWILRSGIEDTANKKLCTQPVHIFSNQKKVTLSVNGISLGTKNTEMGIATFNVPFSNRINRLETFVTVNGKKYKDETEIKFLVQASSLKDTTLPFKEINISLGDKRFFIDDKLEQVWLPEKAYTAGSWGYVGGRVFKMNNTNRLPYGSDRNILQTDYDPIYETQRVGIEQFKLDVPDGKYEVTFLFAELLSNAIRDASIYNLDNGKSVEAEKLEERTFNVLINGQKVIENLSNKNYLIPETAYSTKVEVNVTNGKGIVIDFKSIKGEPILNGLQVKKIF
jgi:beta-galactosidase